MLPFLRRFKKDDFKLLKTASKKTFYSENFCLKVCFCGFEPGRFAVIVPSSVFKKSTVRNKFKRRARAGILKHLEKTKGSFAAVLYAKKGARLLPFSDMEKETDGLFKKAKILKEK